MCAAAFVTCSAAGMALGPLLAVPMSRVPTLHFGPFTFNSVTAGAYVMSLIWLVFLAVTVCFFTEPPVRYGITVPDSTCHAAGGRFASLNPVCLLDLQFQCFECSQCS